MVLWWTLDLWIAFLVAELDGCSLLECWFLYLENSIVPANVNSEVAMSFASWAGIC
jgi:hypothetical protein